MDGKNHENLVQCKKCTHVVRYNNNDTYWDESGSCSVKLVKCPLCGTPIIIKYEEELSLYVNEDERYFF